MKKVELAVFDLDNTLYDWYAAFIPAFYAMVDVAVSILQCDRGRLLDELRSVHIRHHNVEHPFSLFETPTVQALVQEVGDERAWNAVDPAFHAFNRTRKENLQLFPDTIETLQELSDQSIRLVAFTDSSYFSALNRTARLGLDGFFSTVYCRERSPTRVRKRVVTLDDPAHRHTNVVELPAHEAKPNPDVLRDIARREGIVIPAAAYIGDSLAKDVLMAKRAGCLAIWAKFGARVSADMYERLVRISHWSAADIEREKRYAREANNIRPDFVCEASIKELLCFIEGIGPNSSSEMSLR